MATEMTTTTLNNFDDTVDNLENLSRSTQSLLRTMRLDVVLLGSQQDESRNTLSKLEQDWVMLQKMLKEQRTKEREEKEEEAKMKKDKEQQPEDDVVVVDSRVMKQAQKAPQPHSRRHSSSIEWSEEDQEVTRTLNLSDYSNQNHSNSMKSTTPNLDRSNLDWGAPDDEMEEEDRRADRAAPRTVDTILNQADSNGAPVKSMFGWKRDRRLSTSSESSFFFGRRNAKKQDRVDDAASAITEGGTRNSFFGRRNAKKQDRVDDAASAITEGGTPRNSFSWQTMFRWDGGNRNGGLVGIDEKNIGASAVIEEEKDQEDLTDEISTMQIKLRGCDAAATSLQQLVSFQKRQITDLQHERNRLKVLSEYESLLDQSELKSLQTQVESARAERERKEGLLKEAEKCRSVLIDKEEKLKEELECIRMELFMLNMSSE
mmetsp:Transcript_15829/g.25975  ORF Transcript_15829/g.25975 Transcript_15829/m.25975 type:complete len:431 (+) Transcript_15829:218-1510(+)